MQTPFYASGFLYNLKTHRILLLESKPDDDTPSAWSTAGGESRTGEEAITAFQRIISKILNLDLKIKHIYPIYDYFHETLKKINYVFYAEVRNTKLSNPSKNCTPSWISFDDISKLSLNDRSKQDSIVGERVINANFRDDELKKAS